MHPVFDHLALRVSHLDTAIHFYCDTLGWELMSRTVDREHGEAFAYIKMQGGNLELLQLLDETGQPDAYEAPAIQPPYCPHLAVRTDSLEEMVALLEQKNIPIIEGPLEIPDLVKWLYIADPDRNIIEFVQWLTE